MVAPFKLEDVSIHAPLRGATDYCYGYHYFTCVSIHAPLRGATIEVEIPSGIWVSIHAHLRGATPDTAAGKQYSSVSIHAPLRGATSMTDGSLPSTAFQSTHPCGVRQMLDRYDNHGQHVSIHAPLRGATRMMESGEDYTDCFNPRTPAGCDSYSTDT